MRDHNCFLFWIMSLTLNHKHTDYNTVLFMCLHNKIRIAKVVTETITNIKWPLQEKADVVLVLHIFFSSS